jgi:hypothetical protein
VDDILEELLYHGGEIIMRDYIHHAYMECESAEIDKLINEAVIIATRDRGIHNLVMRSVRVELCVVNAHKYTKCKRCFTNGAYRFWRANLTREK